MLSLQQHIEAESARWAASRGVKLYEGSITASVTSSTTSIFTASETNSEGKLQSRYTTHRLSRRSSTSSFATEFEPEPEQQQQQQFVAPRDTNGAPITVYASFEAAAAQSISRLFPAPTDNVEQVGPEEEPRRLVTPGKLYENEEDDDEIVYE
ncbi:hypothetical protein GGS20DRAFT_32751 [Poronia punctata]|nr:hypothetical protein GGS20DRAFT_32751 [Poronia punctata]